MSSCKVFLVFMEICFQCKIIISLFLLTYFFSQKDKSQVSWSNMIGGREAGCKVFVSICENLFLVQDYHVPVSFHIFLSQKDNFQASWYEWWESGQLQSGKK